MKARCCQMLQFRRRPAPSPPQERRHIWPMKGKMGEMRKPLRILATAAVLGIAAIALSGCVTYPSSYGYGYPSYGYNDYYAPPVYVAPPVVSGSIMLGGGWWGGGWGHRDWDDRGDWHR
jgi:hypothetical protein